MSKFSFDTIKDFDKHIDQSIAGYSTLNNIIERLATNYIVKDGTTIDLGCSQGHLLKRLALKNPDSKFIGYDISDNLLPEEWGDYKISFVNADITKLAPIKGTDLALSIFTLQFIPSNKRQAVIDNVYEGLKSGGAFIFAEKIWLKSPKLQDHFTFTLYDLKSKHFSAKEILKKQDDLRKIMKPLNESQNKSMLYNAGFKVENVEVCWASLQFRCWIAIKE